MPREEWGLGLAAPACVSPETSSVRIILVWGAQTCGEAGLGLSKSAALGGLEPMAPAVSTSEFQVTPLSLLRVAPDVTTGDSKAGFSAHRSPAMSTLLEIKSSVLRQVQVCPSFRRRTEEEPASGSADPPEPTAGAWWVPPSPLPSSPDLTHQHGPWGKPRRL